MTPALQVHPLTWVALVIFAFFSGSLPFSVWLGQLFLKRDVRDYGDGNPGATNLFKAGSPALGILALILDVSKAAVPVGLGYHELGIRGIQMALIAIMPILGHSFSPFLRFRGGKALATVLGTWIGLTIWKASLAGVAVTLVGYALFSTSGWAAMLGLGGILVTLLTWLPDPLFLIVLVTQVLVLAWTHRNDLRQRPHLRAWLGNLLSFHHNKKS